MTLPLRTRFFSIAFAGLLLTAGSTSLMAQKTQPEKKAEKAPAKEQKATPTSESLAAELKALQARFNEKAPEEKKKIYEAGIETVDQSGITKTAKQVGDKAPDFMLPSATGPYVRLSDRYKQGPVVLIWYRGGWCPYCNLQLRAWQKHMKDLQDAGGQLIAISPDLADSSMSTTEKNAIEYTVLSDAESQTAKDYGVLFTLPPDVAAFYAKDIDLEAYNGNDRPELPLAATYIIDETGIIQYAFLDADYRKRAEPSEVVEAVKKMKARK